MAPKRPRKARKELPFDWNEERTYIFLELVADYQLRNPRAHNISWIELSDRFDETYKITVPTETLKNKYRTLKEKYHLWTKLISGEAGLGWDSVKKTIVAPTDWWNKKIEEDNELKIFRTNGIPPQMAELMEGIYGGVRATGERCKQPGSRSTPADFDGGGCCTPLSVDELEATAELEVEINEINGPREMAPPGHFARIVRECMDAELEPMANSWPTTIGCCNRKRGQEKQPHTDGERGGNRNIRQSTGATLYQEHLRASKEASKDMVSLCTAGVQSSAQASHQSVDPDGDALKVLDKMVEEGLLRDGESLYYFAVSSLQKSDRFVQYFLKLSDNTKRVRWLQYEKEEHTSRPWSCGYSAT